MLKNIQNNSIMFIKMASLIAVIFALFSINACTGVKLNTISPPLPTTKLRVAIITITTPPVDPRFWMVTHEEYVKNISIPISKYLYDTGMFEIISSKDVETVLGRPESSIAEYWWLRNDCALLKLLGKALYADYVMIISRTRVANHARHNNVLMNVETGAQYSASSDFFGTISGYFNVQSAVKSKMFQIMYQQLFFDAKSDLLATAMRKKHFTPPDVSKTKGELKVSQLQPPPAKPVSESPIMPQEPYVSKQPSAEETPPLAKEPPKTKIPTEVPIPQESIIAKTPQDLSPADKRLEFNKKLEKELQDKTVSMDKKNIVVYDFDTTEHLNVVSLILTEALREELFIIGSFNLVNRENMQKMMQELQLQQSGMVDEKQVVKLGKLLAAQEAVMGRLAVFGTTYILQAKRTDIKTFGTLGVGSLKCAVGNEEDLLSGIPGLARRLIESKK